MDPKAEAIFGKALNLLFAGLNVNQSGNVLVENVKASSSLSLNIIKSKSQT